LGTSKNRNPPLPKQDLKNIKRKNLKENLKSLKENLKNLKENTKRNLKKLKESEYFLLNSI